MHHIFEHYKKTGYLHHAHVIEGSHDEVVLTLLPAIEKHLGIETQGNPDLIIERYESLGVDEARGFKGAQVRRAFAGTKKIFIISAKSFTHEAQNALLKTFEEPTEGTHFFIILPRAEMLLPTLLSRVLIVSNTRVVVEDEAKATAEKFVDASLEERFSLIKKITEKKTGEIVDRELLRRLLDHVERILYTRFASESATSGSGSKQIDTAKILRELYQAKTYLADRGSAPKMLLEHVAIVLPN